MMEMDKKINTHTLLRGLLLCGMISWLGLAWSGCSRLGSQTTEKENMATAIYPITSSLILTQGRLRPGDESMEMIWSGAQIHFTAEADSIWLRATTSPERLGLGPRFDIFLTVVIDGQEFYSVLIPNGKSRHLIAAGLGDGPHEVTLFKRTEALTGSIVVKGIELSPRGQLTEPPSLPARSIQFIGNSITCGYGNLGDDQTCPFSPATEDGFQAYGAIAARELRVRYTAVCYSGRGVWRNYDGSKDGILYDLYQRYHPMDEEASYPFDEPSPDVVAINLGTNDFAKGIPPADDYKGAFRKLIALVKEHHPNAALFLLGSPMLEGERLTLQRTYLSELVEELQAEGMEQVYHFDLTTQGPLGYGCSWHPNLAQHELNGQELAAFIREKMGW